MTMSTYLANALGDHARGRAAFTMPVTYLALYTASPGLGGSANTNEASYSGYTRVACGTGGGSLFGAASGGITQNASAPSFGVIGGGSTVTITHVGIVDSASGSGNLLEFQALSTPVTWNPGQTPTFAINALTDTFS